MGFGAGIEAINAGIRIGAGAYNMYRNYNSTKRKRTASRIISSGGDGTIVTRSRRRVGRRRRATAARVQRSIIGAGKEIIYRWQNTSASYLGPGRLFLGQKNALSPGYLYTPIHFMSLTNQPMGLNHNAKGCFKHGMSSTYYNSTNGTFHWETLPCQDRFGAADISGVWHPEFEEGTDFLKNTKRIFHKWTQIKLNLYGTYCVPVNYTVTVCTMKEQIDPYQFGSQVAMAEGTECHNMFKDMTRSLVHNTVGNNNGRVDYYKDMKIIKRERITINPLSYTDQIDVNALPDWGSNKSQTPHLHELNLFLRHDRMRDYKWSENADETLETRDFTKPGWDLNQPSATMCDVEWGKRVFLIITASSPIALDHDGQYPYQSINDTRTQGSYDICVRQCWRVFD